MQKSIAVFDVNGLNGTVVRASFRSNDPENIIVSKYEVSKTQPIQAHIIGLAAQVLAMIADNGQKNPADVGRYSIIVPESVALRMYQMIKAYKALNGNVEEMTDIMYIDWMKDDTYNFEAVDEDGKACTCNIWEESIFNLCEAYCIVKEAGHIINFVNARTLYRWQITGPDLHDGMEITLNNGINEDGITCTENTMTSGKFIVQQIDIKQRNGQVRSTFFIPRTVAIQDGDSFDRITVQEVMNRKFDIVPHYEGGAVLCNAVKLRMENAKHLPRTKLAKDIKVKIVAANDKTF